MIELKNIYFSYNSNKTVFENASISLRKGKLLLIAGRTGSGKTTLLDMLFGFIPPDRGVRLVNGKPSSEELAGKAAYMISEAERYFYESTVILEVESSLLAVGFSKKEAEQKAVESLRSAGVDESLFTRNPDELSKGEKRKVAIACAIAPGFDLLFADEPLSGLDHLSRKAVTGAFKNLLKEGKTIVCTSHIIEPFFELNPEIALICEKKIKRVEIADAESAIKDFLSAGITPPERLVISAYLQKNGKQVDIFSDEIDFSEKVVEAIEE